MMCSSATNIASPAITVDPVATCRFFARLFLSEPDDDFVRVLAGDSRFAALLPSDLPALRVEFTRLFALNVYPYASVYLDPEPFINSETTVFVESMFKEAGFEPDPAWAIGASDHFGVELMFVAHLLEAGHAERADEFLSQHVLPWAVLFLHAVIKNAAQVYYRVAAQETLAWLMEHARGPAEPDVTRSEPALSVDEDHLDEVVTRLITPSRAGMFLSKAEISNIARLIDLPIGFGDRGLMLASLFRAAGEYGRVANLLTALRAETHSWIEYYEQASLAYPQIAPAIRAWMGRASRTRDSLEQMSRLAATMN